MPDARGGADARRRHLPRAREDDRRPRTRRRSASSSARRRRATTAGSPRARSSRSRPPRSRSATALDPLRAELEKASGSKKGAITKHLHKLLDQLLVAARSSPATTPSSSRRSTRRTSSGPARSATACSRDVLEQAETDAGPEQVRELAYDLCLVEGAKKDDLEVVQQWVDQGQRDGRRHREPPRGRARGGGRGRPPARGDVEAVPRARRRSWSSTTSRSSAS